MAERKRKFGGKKVVLTGPPVNNNGREVWRISVDGERRYITTSATSGVVMNQAMKLYSGALKRLADK